MRLDIAALRASAEEVGDAQLRGDAGNAVDAWWTEADHDYHAAFTPAVALDLLERLKKAESERDRLGDAAFAAYREIGADTDGAQTWQEFFPPIIFPSWAEVVGGEVRRFRADYESDADAVQERTFDIVASNFSSDVDYDGSEVIGRIRSIQHSLEPHDGQPCVVCKNDPEGIEA